MPIFTWSLFRITLFMWITAWLVLLLVLPGTRAAIVALGLVLGLVVVMLAMNSLPRIVPVLTVWIGGGVALTYLASIWVAIPLPFILIYLYVRWDILIRPGIGDVRAFFFKWITKYRKLRRRGLDVPSAIDEFLTQVGEEHPDLADEMRGEGTGKDSDDEATRIRGMLWHMYTRCYEPTMDAEELAKVNVIMTEVYAELKT